VKLDPIFRKTDILKNTMDCLIVKYRIFQAVLGERYKKTEKKTFSLYVGDTANTYTDPIPTSTFSKSRMFK